MMLGRIVAALAVPLLLTGCLLTPGKFTSDLRINADRSFTFAYRGEVIAVDPSRSMPTATPAADEDAASAAQRKADLAKAEGELETKRRAVADALGKEAGYRSVTYVGKGKYLIDYAISGVLTHSFVYPFNLDGEVVFPFIAIEVRKDGAVRVKAPAFGDNSQGTPDMGMGAMGGQNSSAALRDGVFTLTTDAEIVMHNNEDGIKPAGGAKALTWKVTPLTKDPPVAVLKLKN